MYIFIYLYIYIFIYLYIYIFIYLYVDNIQRVPIQLPKREISNKKQMQQSD